MRTRKETPTGPRHDVGMAKRFKDFRKQYIDNNQKHAADLMGIPQSRVSYIENGANPITTEIIKHLEERYKLNPKWLLNGEKPILKTETDKSNTLKNTISLNDRIDRLTQEVLILTKNLTKAWSIIERQESEINSIQKQLNELKR